MFAAPSVSLLGAWLAARLAFTRTNAAWAMVGHVLGLGDRHGENIMIDTLTGATDLHDRANVLQRFTTKLRPCSCLRA